MLAPSTELSKHYASYMLYTTLEYRYSVLQPRAISSLFGISLEPPATYLNGSAFESAPSAPRPFLYAAPASRAALFFPQHWAELHAYAAHRLYPAPSQASRNESRAQPPALELAPLVNGTWAEILLELVRARGYTMPWGRVNSQLMQCGQQ